MRSKFLPIILVTLLIAFLLYVLWGSPMPTSAQTSSEKLIRLGMIGLDTSHVTAFTQTLNDPSRPDHVPGARVVAAFKGGSSDVEASATRIDRFTAELKDKWGVEIVGSIEELCRKVDAVLIESVDGRTHLAQARPVLAARKPVFIDKPFAASLKDAREIVRLARESGTPFFSSSSLRFVTEIQAARKNEQLGEMLGAIAWSPSPTEPHHPDLFWYGIHGVETLFTLMGPGCESVSRVHTKGADVVTGRWKDGRTGTFRGIRDGKQTYGAVAFGSKSVMTIEPKKIDYHGLVVEIVKFFQTGVPPVSPEETLEIMAFMEAADLSKARQGAEVPLRELLP
ncbi:MAG TPA: Gfo/Idh/MocA family oxidoreductase [Blastocatellia bacterium]|nr:Gfo/Idh/MocA family oxidoreductase [Blastocatellia bacterium]